MKKLFIIGFVVLYAALAFADITPLPDPPQRTDPANFATKADAFLGALPTFATEANALATVVNGYKTDAETAQAAAEAAQAVAQTSANFKGNWSDQTGAAAIPYSVYHEGNYWQLVSNLADVTASEPGVTAAWKVIGGVILADDLDQLQGFSVVDGAVVYLKGRATAGDGGQGVFTGKTGDYSAQVTADTLFGIYAPSDADSDGSEGCWVRQDIHNVIDSKWFGTGSAAVQGAVDLFPGRTILIYSDTYTSTVTVDTTGLGDTSVSRFIGDGMYKTVIDNQTGGPAFYVTSGTAAEFAYGFELKDVSVISTGPDAGTIGIRIDGCRFANIERVRIEGMASHGIYGLSSVGDYTDTSQINISHTQVQNCGGYGIYPSVTSTAIQYSWNIDQCRIGLNTLGGIFMEGMTNSNITNTGVYYNTGFGLKLAAAAGGVTPKLVRIEECEFDTNDGVQIDLEAGVGIDIKQPYLVANVISGKTFSHGIVTRSGVTSVVIDGSYPRIAPSIAGIVVHEFESGCIDVVVRDTRYNGYSSLNGDMYQIDEDTVVIDDRDQRNRYDEGTYTAELRDSTLAKVSATTVTAYWARNGNQITVHFRNLSNIDTSAFAGTDVLGITLPFTAKSGATTYGSAGSAIITTDGNIAAGTPIPVVDNGGTIAAFVRANSGGYLTASHLTTGVSDIRAFSISYLLF